MTAGRPPHPTVPRAVASRTPSHPAGIRNPQGSHHKHRTTTRSLHGLGKLWLWYALCGLWHELAHQLAHQVAHQVVRHGTICFHNPTTLAWWFVQALLRYTPIQDDPHLWNDGDVLLVLILSFKQCYNFLCSTRELDPFSWLLTVRTESQPHHIPTLWYGTGSFIRHHHAVATPFIPNSPFFAPCLCLCLFQEAF